MKTPHKYADMIKAWADGAKIQQYSLQNEWGDVDCPFWDEGIFRVKPENLPDVVEPWSIYINLNYRMESVRMRSSGKAMGPSWLADVVLTWDGNTGKLKEIKLLEAEL